jgi:transcriptional regulator with XRE-family HTH domain
MHKPKFRFDNAKLLKKRLSLGWSQRDVAEKIKKKFGEKGKVTQATVCHVEQGVNQWPGTVFKVAAVLSVDMDDILIPEEEPAGAHR